MSDKKVKGFTVQFDLPGVKVPVPSDADRIVKALEHIDLILWLIFIAMVVIAIRMLA